MTPTFLSADGQNQRSGATLVLEQVEDLRLSYQKTSVVTQNLFLFRPITSQPTLFIEQP